MHAISFMKGSNALSFAALLSHTAFICSIGGDCYVASKSTVKIGPDSDSRIGTLKNSQYKRPSGSIPLVSVPMEAQELRMSSAYR